MKLHELTSFLSSSDPADRLQGLEALEQVRGPAQLPVLVHLIHVCHPGIRETLLARVAGHEKPAIAQALGQLLESDAPHPESALFYLSMAGDPAYNGLMLSMLPQCAEPIQVGILQVLSRTADESTAITLAPLAPHLGSSARQAMARLLASLPTQKGAGTPPPSLPEDRYVNFSLTAPRALATGSSDLPAAPRAEAVAPHARDLEPQAEGPASKGEDREPAPSLGNRIAERHRRERLGVWAGRARELALRAGGFAVWMAALSLLARASWESLHLTGPMRFLTPAGLGAALFASLAGWRRLTHLDRAALAGITLAACAAAALQAAPGAPPAFALFGRGPGFWGNVMCLAATALVVFATLAQTEWPRMARLASIALAAYVALGFVRALAIGVPFESALVSGAW
ncbi:MAG: hypothetical protein HY303_18340, partial [Candidatus Wallbacteria bacterium]|nr:hypothetical protein [Candidatus Wallbacteria bacterium]